MNDPQPLLQALENLVRRIEARLPPVPAEADPGEARAFRWRGEARGLEVIAHPKALQLTDIRCQNRQKTDLDRNTRQFLNGFPANNALLWGARGTGKSSLVKALLTEYGDQGLRLIEIDRQHLTDLPEIVERLDHRPEKFILFCDDLSFGPDDPSYTTLKAVLDGSLCALPDHVLIYATSNRRHLMPETLMENLESRPANGEIHPGESVEEKISLSERFGLWIPFHPFTQDQYLEIVAYWLERSDASLEAWQEIRRQALRWALQRGSRSGRVAWQFARDWCGRQRLPDRPVG